MEIAQAEETGVPPTFNRSRFSCGYGFRKRGFFAHKSIHSYTLDELSGN